MHPIQPTHIDLLWAEPRKPAAPQKSLLTWLSPGEQCRAASFPDDLRRSRYISSHANVRGMLARYLATPLHRAEFSIGPGGKPFLPGANLHFNISHSAGRIACAISRETQLGVDIESIRLRSTKDFDFFTRAFPQLTLQLAELPPDQRARALTSWWTRSEALGKAIGEGMPFGIRAYHQLLLSAPHSAAVPRWQFVDFNLGNDYCGTVAARVQSFSLFISKFTVPPSASSEFNEICKEQAWSA